MKLGDVGGYALANLKRHKLRTGLTASGVALGIATLTVLVSLGAGLKGYATQQFDHAELTTRLRVMPKGTKDAMSAMFRGGRRKVSSPPLTDEQVAALGKIEGVVAAYPEITTPIGVFVNRQITPVFAEALPVQAIGETHRRSLLAGKYWDADDAPAACVLPSALLADLGFKDAQAALGQTLQVSSFLQLQDYERVVEEAPNPRGGPPLKVVHYERAADAEWTPLEVPIIGVYDSKPFGYMGQMLQVPKDLGIKIAKELDPRERYKDDAYRQVVVKVKSHTDLDRVQQEIEAQGYDTQSVFDILQQIKVAFAIFQVILGLFGGIGVAVAFFGIANTMVMAVLERTREIGVLKALGARDRDVRRMFVAEAAGIGFLGGAAGLLGGWAFGQVANAIAFAVLPALKQAGLALFVVEPWLVAGCLGLSVVVATLAGLLPAVRAARLDPVDSLRRD